MNPARDLFTTTQPDIRLPLPRGLIIHVDRLARVDYGLRTPVYPDVERQRPLSYDLSRVVQSLTETQCKENAFDDGDSVFAWHQDKLEDCLSLADGRQIVAKGAFFPYNFFKEKRLFLWGGVATNDETGYQQVPYLKQRTEAEGGAIGIHWIIFSRNASFDRNAPALMLKT